MINFETVKQFPFCNYRNLTVSLDYLPEKLDRYVKEYGLDLNPPFQRDYVWSDFQKEKYVEYILRGGMAGNQIYFNHPNWLGTDSKVGEFVIIDGKQRLNALSGFICGEVKAFGEYIDGLSGLRLSAYEIYFNVFKISDQKELVDFYIGLNSGGSIHTPEEIQKAIDYKNSL